ncbi:unnamed protein product [Periconia digitata]|uniref:HypA n=1 Tax=Periconia digitata TaxID=1303443 RepID=A0A9W4U7T4_9PLEO|nr:unnamed protein product [Periconia digitata]
MIPRSVYIRTASSLRSNRAGIPKTTTARAVHTRPSFHFRPVQENFTRFPKYSARNMATASTIKLEAAQKPAFYVPDISEESAKVASQLLQENHEKHHIFFNQEGFHNHIVHHLLTLFALKASPAEIQKGYDDNLSYQRPVVALDPAIVEDMRNPERFKTYLGRERYYNDYLVFFKEEIKNKGWEAVVTEYVFKGDERADDMLVRMFGGFLHPIIHLGFGVEFQQPAIIAESLAQAAVHDDWMKALFIDTEEAIKSNGSDPQKTPSLVSLLEKMRADKTLSSSAHWKDGNKIRDGILKRAPKEMIQYASQYVITPDQLEEKTAEMINATVYYTSTAQHPPHVPKFDFFYMHSVNSSIFFSAFLNAPFLTATQKTRLLEWKVRCDLAMYVSRGSPPLLLSDIENYTPPRGDESWSEVFERVNRLPDDGHTCKLVRALANGEKACKPFEGKQGFAIQGELWRKIAGMVVDSVQVGGGHWVRSCGFEEAWADVPLREGAKL